MQNEAEKNPSLLNYWPACLPVVSLLLCTGLAINMFKDDNKERVSANAVLRQVDEDFWAINKTPEISMLAADRAPIVRALTIICGDLTIIHRGGLVSNRCDADRPLGVAKIEDVKPDDLVGYAKRAAETKVEDIKNTYSVHRPFSIYTDYKVPISTEDLAKLKTEEVKVRALRDALTAATPDAFKYGRRMTTPNPGVLP